VFLRSGKIDAKYHTGFISSLPYGPHNTVSGVPMEYFEPVENLEVVQMPCICLLSATREVVTGWVASQVDQLAEDWTYFSIPINELAKLRS
jgi:Protein of unknown function (DUF2829)